MKKISFSKQNLLFNLSQGLKNEQIAYESYHQFISQISDQKIKKNIESIMNDELRHIQIVEDLINIINKHYIDPK